MLDAIYKGENGAVDVSKYVLTVCTEKSESITNLHLQKILYFLQVEVLRKYDMRLFEDDIEAWKFGPVVREVYHEYRGYGGLEIARIYDDCKNIFDDFEVNNKNFKKFLDNLIIKLSKENAWNLVKISHSKNSAWEKTFKDGAGHYDVICVEMLREDEVDWE